MRTRIFACRVCPKLTIDSWGSPVVRQALYQSGTTQLICYSSTLGRNSKYTFVFLDPG